MEHDDLLEVLALHSNEGTLSLIDSAQHFLITRATYEALHSDESMSEERYRQLASEAWITFVSSSLQAYDTWLFEALPEENRTPELVQERRNHLDGILSLVLGDWTEWVAEIKPTFVT